MLSRGKDAPTATGPVRNRNRRRSGGPRPERYNKKPKTQDDLDKELDAFMGEDTAVAGEPQNGASTNGADVEMTA